MKGLDTPVPLALLEGDRSARDLFRKLREVEVATTETNFLEIGYLAARGAPRVRAGRREALGRLRGKFTVHPIDPRGVAGAEGCVTRGEVPASLEVRGYSEP